VSRRRLLCFLVLSVAAAACTTGGHIDATAATSTTTSTALPTTTVGGSSPGVEGGVARILLVGDVMVGRDVAPVAAADPEGVFAGVRHDVAGADIAAANLESPLTDRPHVSDNPNALEADPAAAGLVADAGFDLASIANNHAGDAGPLGVTDTVTAVTGAGMEVIGAGADAASASAPAVMTVHGVTVAFLAFDATQLGLEATATTAGVARYSGDEAQRQLAAVRQGADVVVVSLHGGIEYLPTSDPAMGRIAADLTSWGADVVWGHGAHVVQPISVMAGERPAVVATSLGNFLFDQGRAGTDTGAVLEVLVDTGGVIAYRTGTADHPQQRVGPITWDLPTGDAALLDLEWWQLVRDVPVTVPPAPTELVETFDGGDVVAASAGDATGDGDPDLVLSFRRPFQPTPVNQAAPDRQWQDATGRSAHLGVYVIPDLTPEWIAGTLFRPIAAVAACDGSLALAFDELDDPGVVATSAWVWRGFGFTVPAELPGPGVPGCSDVDHDGAADPVLTRE
jgi:poly-gamma-glutamate capsule biosynthesis protein CapA/YwtB (metallophosphatase superfamily)